MYGRSNIKQLRQNGKNPDFCLSVTPEQLDSIITLLLDDVNLSRHQRIDLIATISNILLINRELHQNSFTVYWSNKVLDYLNSVLSILLHELDNHDETPSGSEKIDLKHFTFDFNPLISVYRLIFLILYDGLAQLDHCLDATNDSLNEGLEITFKYFSEYENNADYEKALIEIFKGVYTLYHKYGTDLSSDTKISADKYITIIEKIKTLDFVNLKPNQLTVINYFMNIIMLVNTYQESLTFDEIVRDIKVHRDSLEIAVMLIVRDFKNLDCPPLTNLFIVVNFAASELNKHSGDQEGMEELKALKALLQSAILPTPQEKSIALDPKLEPSVDFTREFPVQPQNYIYFRCLEVIRGNSTGSDARKGTLSDSLDSSTNIALDYLAQVIIQCFFDLSFDPKDPSPTTHLSKFLDYVGYVYAKDFIDNNGISIPEDIDINKYLKPNPKYMGGTEGEHRMSNGSGFESLSQSLNSILNNIDSNGSTPQPPEMTQEEKEVEAERLFRVFDKMERNSVFEGFKNPVREWQQSGKFEDLPDDPQSDD